MNILELFKKTIELIKKEPMVLLPSLVFFFIYQTMNQIFGLSVDATNQSFTKGILNLIITGWMIELIFKAITIIYANKLINKNKNIHINIITLKLKKHLKDLIIGTGLLTIPLFIVFLYMIRNPENIPSLLVFIGIVIVIIFSISLPLIPVIIIIEGLNWRKTYIVLINLIKKEWRNIGLFMVIILGFNFTCIILGEMGAQIPIIGESVIKIIIQSVSTGFIYVITIYFYLYIKEINTTPKTINPKE